MGYRSSNGFILPSVLIIGLGTMLIGLSLIQSSTSIRSSIDSVYYNKLATEAAEAGVSYATYCLKSSGYLQLWTAARPLTQSTDCVGNPLAKPVVSLAGTGNTAITFSVGDITRGPDNSYLINAASTIALKSNAGTLVRTYTGDTLKAVGQKTITFGAVTYGYFPENSAPGIATSGAFFAVRGSDGRYRVVGANGFGQLGNGTTSNTLIPQTYTTPGSSPAIRAFSNFLSQGFNLFILNGDGEVYGAGLGNYGQLGNTKTIANNPTPQKFLLPGTEKGTFVAPKGDATYVLTDQYNIYAAGRCDLGQLGNGSSTCGNVSTPAKVQGLPTPNIADPNTLPSENISLDAQTVFVRMQGGSVYGWGQNALGQFGNGTTTNSSIAKKIGTFGDVGKAKAVQIAFDGDTLYVVDSNGYVWATGRNNYGEMGLNHSTYYYTSFQKVPIPAAAGKAIQVSTDQWSAYFLTESGDVYDAGLNITGELGNNLISNYTDTLQKFILPAGVKGKYVYNASTGTDGGPQYNNTFVIGDNGKVYGAGANVYGQLGNGATSAREKYPVEMKIFDGTTIRAKDIIAGLGTTIILSEDSIYYTVGNNTYGQLGNGTNNSSSTPAAAEYLKTIPAYLF